MIFQAEPLAKRIFLRFALCAVLVPGIVLVMCDEREAVLQKYLPQLPNDKNVR